MLQATYLSSWLTNTITMFCESRSVKTDGPKSEPFRAFPKAFIAEN